MAEKDFYDIKGLGELPSENEAEHPAPPYQPLRPSKTKKPKNSKSGRNLLIVIVVIIILAALGGGGYALAKHHKPSTKQPTSSTSTTAPKPAATATASGTTQYISNGSDLNLSFSYPSTWTVTPASGGNSNDQTITLSSPLTTIPAAGGGSVTGKVVATIRPGSASLTELGANNPTAAVASTQFAYSAPTTNQYQYPYLTFIHFTNGTATAGAFEEVMVTGTTAFTAGEGVTTIALTGLDPIISASFSQCANTACTASSATPLGITTNTWQNTEIFEQVQALFASLKLN